MTVRRIDHVGIIVDDLAAAKAFFLDLGLEVMGEAHVEGERAERITALPGLQSDIVMLRTPDGGTAVELSEIHAPRDESGIQPPQSNTLGIRHITFVVDDVDATLARLTTHGATLVGDIQTYENSYKVCYIRGPEGIILELAEELAK